MLSWSFLYIWKRVSSCLESPLTWADLNLTHVRVGFCHTHLEPPMLTFTLCIYRFGCWFRENGCTWKTFSLVEISDHNFQMRQRSLIASIKYLKGQVTHFYFIFSHERTVIWDPFTYIFAHGILSNCSFWIFSIIIYDLNGFTKNFCLSFSCWRIVLFNKISFYDKSNTTFSKKLGNVEKMYFP